MPPEETNVAENDEVVNELEAVETPAPEAKALKAEVKTLKQPEDDGQFHGFPDEIIIFPDF